MLNKSILPLADAGIEVQFRRLPGGVHVIHLLASQNLPPSPQPEAEKELIPTREISPTPGFCVTTPPAPATTRPAAQSRNPLPYGVPSEPGSVSNTASLQTELRPLLPTESNSCRNWQDLFSAISAPSARPGEEANPAPSVDLVFAFAFLRVFLHVFAPPRQIHGLFGSGFAGLGSGCLEPASPIPLGTQLGIGPPPTFDG